MTATRRITAGARSDRSLLLAALATTHHQRNRKSACTALQLQEPVMFALLTPAHPRDIKIHAHLDNLGLPLQSLPEALLKPAIRIARI